MWCHLCIYMYFFHQHSPSFSELSQNSSAYAKFLLNFLYHHFTHLCLCWRNNRETYGLVGCCHWMVQSCLCHALCVQFCREIDHLCRRYLWGSRRTVWCYWCRWNTVFFRLHLFLCWGFHYNKLFYLCYLYKKLVKD